MAVSKNVTLTLPEDVLRKAKHLAVDRGTSLSRLVAELVEEQMKGDGGYVAAMQRQKALMRRGLDLGFNGQVPWTRDDLHAR